MTLPAAPAPAYSAPLRLAARLGCTGLACGIEAGTTEDLLLLAKTAATADLTPYLAKTKEAGLPYGAALSLALQDLLHRSNGAGTDPLTVIAVRVLPVKFIGVSPMVRSNSVPDNTLACPGPLSAQLALGQNPNPATAPPKAKPWTNRRREGSSGPPCGPRKSSCDM